jgi:hypothetical protein
MVLDNVVICNTKNILNILKKPTEIYLENKNKLKYKNYGIINYGSLSDNINEDDNEQLNIIIPGYANKIVSNHVYSKDVIGILWLSDGNHKIFINIDHDGFDCQKSTNDTNKYINEYLKINQSLNGFWIEPFMLLN